VIRETGVAAKVIAERIEAIPPLHADIISARALAALPQLLAYCERHLAAGGSAILPKGANWQKELKDAQAEWNFTYQVAMSVTEAGSAILSVTGVSRA
jgi:16S rRNA (guanine527-N7)-methyltransferase